MKRLFLLSLGFAFALLSAGPAMAFKDGMRALNAARMRAESINGGLSQYRADKCMYSTGTRGGQCLVSDIDGFIFIFYGGEPGWQETATPPSIETEIHVSEDGQSSVEVIYNGIPR